MQEEVTQKVIVLSVKIGKGTAKLTEQALQKAIRQFLKQYQKGRIPNGKQTLRQLKRHGAYLSNIEITQDNIGAFSKTAKEFEIDFALKKDQSRTPPHYYVFFKSPDMDNITQAFQKFSREKLQRDKKPSIRKALVAAKEKSKQINQNRDKMKNIDRGRAL